MPLRKEVLAGPKESGYRVHAKGVVLCDEKIGIMPGWYGMENGQRPEMGGTKKKPNGKEGSAGRGQKNGFSRDFSIFLHFRAIWFTIFCPFPSLGRFPCHTSPVFKTIPSKNPSKNLVFTENPYRRLLRALLRRTFC